MSWISDPNFTEDQPFGPQTLPYGVVDGGVAVRVGDQALLLGSLALGKCSEYVQADSLDPLLKAGRPVWSALRAKLKEIVTATSAPKGAELTSIETAKLPFTVGDYVDFYSSRHHAENVGRMFRPDGDALTPNWTHLPIGYHGRAGTVYVSGTEIVRPNGQRRGSEGPKFGPSERLDIEAEVGFVCGGPQAANVSTSRAAEHVFGVALVNDWSARDIQKWEYQPLGPFLAKNFATTVSPFVVTTEALAPFRCPAYRRPDGDPQPLEHLRDETDQSQGGFDLTLEVYP